MRAKANSISASGTGTAQAFPTFASLAPAGGPPPGAMSAGPPSGGMPPGGMPPGGSPSANAGGSSGGLGSLFSDLSTFLSDYNSASGTTSSATTSGTSAIGASGTLTPSLQKDLQSLAADFSSLFGSNLGTAGSVSGASADPDGSISGSGTLSSSSLSANLAKLANDANQILGGSTASATASIGQTGTVDNDGDSRDSQGSSGAVHHRGHHYMQAANALSGDLNLTGSIASSISLTTPGTVTASS